MLSLNPGRDTTQPEDSCISRSRLLSPSIANAFRPLSPSLAMVMQDKKSDYARVLPRTGRTGSELGKRVSVRRFGSAYAALSYAGKRLQSPQITSSEGCTATTTAKRRLQIPRVDLDGRDGSGDAVGDSLCVALAPVPRGCGRRVLDGALGCQLRSLGGVGLPAVEAELVA